MAYLGKLSNITFSFCDRELGCHAGVVSLSSPADVYVHRDDRGVNKIVIKAKLKEISFLVYMYSDYGKKSIAVLLQNIISARGLHVVMPLIAVIIVLLGWWKWMRG
jgi:hypothetical protein